MKKYLLFILLLSMAAVVADAEEFAIPAEDEVIQFETKLGIVTFAHLKHAELSITQCSTCHHTLQPADTAIKPCHECHLHNDSDLKKAKDAFHIRCIGCHEYTAAAGDHAGPLKKKCKLCHIK